MACGRRSRAIGGSSPDLNEIIFKTCKRKGIFLTFVPSRHPKGERQREEAEGLLREGLGRGRAWGAEGSGPGQL